MKQVGAGGPQIRSSRFFLRWNYSRFKSLLFALVTISVISWSVFVYLYGYDLIALYENVAAKPEIQKLPQLCRISTNASVVHVEIIGTNRKKAQVRFGKEQEGYVFVLPKKIEPTQTIGNETCNGVHHLLQILDAFSQFDGATCLNGTKDSKSINIKRQKIRTCFYEIKNWTMIIKNSSRRDQQYNMFHRKVSFSICNIVEVPFVIRRAVLNKIGLRPSHGEATFLDFFLRSNGTLKIATSNECSFTDGQLKNDRGAMAGNNELYLDYGLLGYHHKILRIVREDSITWTECSSRNASCRDIPEQLSTPSKNFVSPYCCKTQLNRILVDTVDALNQIGLEYRVCFGTLLGAVRTKTIIPWDTDIDICVKASDYKNRQAFKSLESILKLKRYSCPFILGMRRVLPLSPLVRYIPNSYVLSESNLFRQEVLEMMQDMLPIQKPDWKSLTYVDFYPYDKIYKTNTSNVTIDGRDYLTGRNPHSLLFEWFGKGYMSTDDKDRTNSDPISSKKPPSIWKKFWDKALALIV
jgi:hypothetical protein